MNSKKIIVTGAAGFIGRWVVSELLERDFEVCGIDNFSSGTQENVQEFKDNDDFSLIEADISEKGAFHSVFDSNIHSCIHLAAKIDVHESLEDPVLHFKNNVVGTQNVLEACRKTDTPIAIVGTCMVYDVTHQEAIHEKSTVKPASPYAGSKLAAERMAESYYHGYDLPVTILRPFNTYGPYQTGGVIPVFLNRDVNNSPLKIYGDGTQTRDFLYVTDCARFIVDSTLSDDTAGEILNAGTGNDVSINNLAEIISTGKTPIKHVEHHHPQSEIQKLVCDSSKAQNLINWEPEVSLEDGIQATRKWLKNK